MENVIYFKNREEFLTWLEDNNDSAGELWLGYYKKSSGHRGITWSESVDAALCFGWIDGIRKTVDEQSYKIRFTRRKENSVWSAINVQKVEKLMNLGLMREEGKRLFESRSDTKGYTAESRNVPLDAGYEQRIRENEAAWQFFSNLAPSYKRDSIWWVMSAKREETRLKRLGILIESSEKRKKIPALGS